MEEAQKKKEIKEIREKLESLSRDLEQSEPKVNELKKKLLAA